MMLRENVTRNMKVRFGRPGGELTRGVVQKINQKTAKVVTSEPRGKTPAGAEWNVGFSWLYPDDNSPVVATKPAPVELKYNPFNEMNPYYELLAGCYNHLSPEALTCDGEAPMYRVQQRRSELNRRIRGLCHAIGQNLTEDQVWQWLQSKIEYQKANPNMKMAR